MAKSPKEKALTSDQEFFIWDYTLRQKEPDDRHPNDVIQTDYNGDRCRYLLDMAKWHQITFCDTCSKAKQECRCGVNPINVIP
ncbi:MAG: hypothetical protein A2908_04760 [Candidatus Staskawiczbacteria bacterium RIFCSPLOWO2_01_FULL_38_12b]|uniref:Uncharacterized protein n=1 Tax=Candidatus Staskawiczbacteria bacterium RIFCSPLOWO2_01_FULL_38_12b TaxID=1802214 RepID=A0A1G2IGY7_9BACT|nr:MAG: hypothetical protein A2908_04760 [Candidatus Staskawiczbacteria bacterium RIFCSPLOWO2_01_FULL_38_12b]